MSVLTIRVENEFLAQLKALAWSRRVPVSTVIRELLRDGYQAKVSPATPSNQAAAASTSRAAEDKYLRRQAEDIMFFSAFAATLIQNSPILGTGDRNGQTQFARESANKFCREFEAKWGKLKE